ASGVASAFRRTSGLSSSSKGSHCSDVTDVILPAYTREPARVTPVHIVRRRRKLPASDRVDRVHQPLLRLDEHLAAIVRKERHDAPRTFEREVHGLAERPRTASVRAEPLLRAQRVNRELQRAPAIRRPAELVVDQPKRPVVEKIETIDFAGERDRARTLGGVERELAAQFMLEEASDDRYRPL